jgi:hypothetical protein
MRRWAAALTCASVLALAAGCTSGPAGVDGDLNDDWPALPAAQQFRPADHTCHDKLTRSVSPDDYAPIPCDQAHVAETVAVGDLPAASGLARPADGAGRAFQQCTKQANAFLGADWRTGWLILQPVLPSSAAWSGGARWYRCDLAETSPVDGAVVDRTSTIKAGLQAPGSTLRMACADPTIKDEQVTEMHPVTCSKAHTAEFAGLWPTTARSADDLSTSALEKGCDATIAKFAGVPDNSSITARVGWLGFPPDQTSWQSGDRAIRCFLWLNGEKMTGSYRRAGPSKLKIHYVQR